MVLRPKEILEEQAIPAGTLRITIQNGDGSVEGVALNNILSALTTLCTDFSANRFGAYIIVPVDFWKQMKKEWGELHGKSWKLLPKNKHGGYMGLFPDVTVYVEAIEHVVVRPDVGTLTFSFVVGTTHDVTINKEVLIKKYGFERVGYDTRLVFVPWWARRGFGYAPLPILQQWVEEDEYPPAVELLRNPPKAALEQWYRQGFLNSPEELLRLEGPKDVEHSDGSVPGQWVDINDTT